MKKVYHLIREMGVTSKYRGYYFTAEAVGILLKQQGQPIRITKDVYPILSAKFGVPPQNIEHSIRTVINVCWITNPGALDRIAGYHLMYRPTNSDFIDMLAFYLAQAEG